MVLRCHFLFVFWVLIDISQCLGIPPRPNDLCGPCAHTSFQRRLAWGFRLLVPRPVSHCVRRGEVYLSVPRPVSYRAARLSPKTVPLSAPLPFPPDTALVFLFQGGSGRVVDFGRKSTRTRTGTARRMEPKWIAGLQLSRGLGTQRILLSRTI